MSRLFFDMETIPDQSEGALARAAERVKVPATYKRPEAIETYRNTRALEGWQKTALDGLFGEVCSIAYAFDDEPPQSMTRGVDVAAESETDLLYTFFGVLVDRALQGEGAHTRIEWVGHNVIDFDLRFLKQRAVIRGIKPGFHLPADARHDKGAVFDTMKEWSGFRGFVKQSALQHAFGIPEDATLECVGGDQVAGFWASKQYDVIGRYNRDDIRVCRDVYRRQTWQ